MYLLLLYICFILSNHWWTFIKLIKSFQTHFVQQQKRQALNEVDAYDICNEAFQQSAHYDTCLQIVPNFSNETLVNCINDLVVSNMTMD